MKRTELIEYGIIVIGLIFCYQTLIAVISVLFNLLFSFQSNFAPGFVETILPSLLYILIYFFSFYFVVRYKKPLAKYINGPTDETVNISLGKKSILQIVIIAICLFAIVSTIPEILIHLFKTFKRSVESYDRFADNFNNEQDVYDFWTNILSLVLTLVLLKFSGNVAGYFSKETEGISTINQKPTEETN